MPGEGSLSGAEGVTIISNPEVKVEESEAPSQGHGRASSSADQPRAQSRNTLESRKIDYTPTVPQRTPKERFRAAVRKVIALHTTSAILRGGLGAEPGVDPRRHSAFAAYGNVQQRCVIDIIDYSSVRYSYGRMMNNGFINFLQNPQASAREPWVKVRWINIGGISWDVISALALKYGNVYPHGRDYPFSIL